MSKIVPWWNDVLDLADRIDAALAWLPPLLARLIVGTVFVQSGWGKLHSLDNVIEFFRELGIPWPELQAPFAAANELVCGALLLVGLATRFASIPLLVVMLVAIRTAIWPNLDTASGLLNASELLYMALLVGLATNGGGSVAVDALLAPRVRNATATSTARALVGGSASARRSQS